MLWNMIGLKLIKYVGFEVLTAVVLKGTIFWDITPCGPLSVNQRFGGYITSIFRVEKISRTRNQLAICFHAG
jgi:hypothetical protein